MISQFIRAIVVCRSLVAAVVIGLTGCAKKSSASDCAPGFVELDDGCFQLCASAPDCFSNEICADDRVCRPIDLCGAGCPSPSICMLQGCVSPNPRKPGVTLSPTSGLFTTESGGTAIFSAVLNSLPTATVTLGFSSSDETEGFVAPESLAFTTDNWNMPQMVVVTGVDDTAVDGDQAFAVVSAPTLSSDAAYQDIDPPDVAMTNMDNDGPGIRVNLTTSPLVTTEGGGTATFSVQLNTQPTGDVTLPLVSSDAGEGTLSTNALVFTTTNWATAQTVTLSGVDDPIADGDQSYTVVTSPAQSSDADYSNRAAIDVAAINRDNDGFGVSVMPTSLQTQENGVAVTFSVQINTEPLANVIAGVASSDTSEGAVSPSQLTFTPANWTTPQVVTVTPVDDAVLDGLQVYAIVVGALVSNDSNYSGLDPDDVTVHNVDDEPNCQPACTGTCAMCVGTIGNWSCQASGVLCTGNCGGVATCTGSGSTFNCTGNASACTGDCDQCVVSGTVATCGGMADTACPGNCPTCSRVSDTEWSCQGDDSKCVGDCGTCIWDSSSWTCVADSSKCTRCDSCLENVGEYSCSNGCGYTSDCCCYIQGSPPDYVPMSCGCYCDYGTCPDLCDY